jgi:hypothetical protein
MDGWVPLTLACVAGMIVGAILGFVLKKRTRGWCADCGNVLTCPACAAHVRAGKPIVRV